MAASNGGQDGADPRVHRLVARRLHCAARRGGRLAGPCLLGDGIRLWRRCGHEHTLALHTVEPLQDGVVRLDYSITPLG
jgi:hypothetical protein